MSESPHFFPLSPRVVYERTPLIQVICQVRFPAVLRIDTEAPAGFQERIRASFPLYQRAAGASGLEELPSELLRALGNPTGPLTHNFRTEDGTAAISLSSESLSLTTTAYSTWEVFSHGLEAALAALSANYAPSFFSRVGLRYQNLISRPTLELSGVPWRDLLAPSLAAELHDPIWEHAVLDARRQIRCRLLGDGAFLLQHGVVTPDGQSEFGYLIDFDFYRDEKIEVDDAPSLVGRFHDHSGSAFRWSISDRLHEALGPKSVA